MRILGLDLGSKRIGVAISDSLGITAQGLGVIEKDKGEEVIEYIKGVVAKEGVSEIVVGLPLNMNGSHGPKAQEAEAFANGLREKLRLPVNLWDERLTTMEVERIMIAGGASRNKRKKKKDKLAAQVILQSYLSARKTT